MWKRTARRSPRHAKRHDELERAKRAESWYRQQKPGRQKDKGWVLVTCIVKKKGTCFLFFLRFSRPRGRKTRKKLVEIRRRIQKSTLFLELGKSWQSEWSANWQSDKRDVVSCFLFLKCFFKKCVKTAVPKDGNHPGALVLTKLVEWYRFGVGDEKSFLWFFVLSSERIYGQWILSVIC